MSAETITALGDGRYRVSDGGRHRLAYAVAAGTATWVFLDGQVYVVSPAADGRTSRTETHTDDTALAAPMPATVVAVHVQPGQAVRRGDVLVVLEAMKMELPITAPRDGRVARVACRAGELVQPGIPLLDLA